MRKLTTMYRVNHWNPFKETEYHNRENAGIMTHSRASHIKKMKNLMEPLCIDFPWAISFNEKYYNRWWPWDYTSEEERDRDFEQLRKWGWKTDKEV